MDGPETQIEHNIESWLTDSILFDLYNRFRRDGFIKVRGVVSDEVRESVRDEVLRLLDKNAERRDLLLETTGGTPRFMSVVRSEFIAAESELINRIYRCDALVSALSRIAGEALYPCPSADEEFLITRQEKVGDTHGWHWGDFSFALIWIIDTPALEAGGMLQCVPHTAWDKSRPRIHDYLCANPIATHGFVPGDLYLLRTDTTLHRTVPLNRDARRIILNMTWAAAKDVTGTPTGNDRWWENSSADAAKVIQS